MPEELSEKEILQHLKEAGCGRKMQEQFLRLEKEKNVQGQLQLLSDHRRILQQRVRDGERKIYCLDYLVYQMRKHS